MGPYKCLERLSYYYHEPVVSHPSSIRLYDMKSQNFFRRSIAIREVGVEELEFLKRRLKKKIRNENWENKTKQVEKSRRKK